MAELSEAMRSARAWACYDCGKCTATCPVARAGGVTSPRRQLAAAGRGETCKIAANGSLAACLTCGLCDRRCPARVGYTELVQKLREVSFTAGVEPECPHGGALQSLMRMMARGGTRQDRLSWLDADLATVPEQGEVFLWVGCAPYFDAFFSELEVATLNGPRAAVRLLNRAGVTPVVSPEERCCGHDLLWAGDRASFDLLARHNVELVKASGAKLLLTTCAECVRTWRRDYQPLLGGTGLEVLHLSEWLAEHVGELGLTGNGAQRVTLQDPCRLGRHLGVYEPPRQALAAVPGLELTEMRRSGAAAICCAGATWSHCDRFAKRVQVERLREARATGAGVLATACPKCQIHLRCAMRDPNLGEGLEIQLRDLTELVAAALPGAGAGSDDNVPSAGGRETGGAT